MHKRVVVDSSVLIALNSKGNLEDCLRHWVKKDYEAIISKAIAEEVIDEPKKFAEEIREKSPILADKIISSVNRIEAAVKIGLIKIETVDYRKYSKLMDNVRKHLSKFDAKPEHAIKKGDPELIALVIQLYDETQEKVYVSTLDKGLLKALQTFSKKVEFKELERQ